jgi:hypothetical protein
MNIKNVLQVNPIDIIKLLSLITKNHFKLLYNNNIQRPTFYTENIIYSQNRVAKKIYKSYYKLIENIKELFINNTYTQFSYYLFNFDEFTKNLDFYIKIMDEYYQEEDIQIQLQIVRNLVLNYYCIKKITSILIKYFNSTHIPIPSLLDNYSSTDSLINNVVEYYNQDNRKNGEFVKMMYQKIIFQ